MKKDFYKYKIKEGAYKTMEAILLYPEIGFGIIDNAKCCVFETLRVESCLKNTQETILYNEVYGVKVLDYKVNEYALLLPDLLENLPENEWIIK